MAQGGLSLWLSAGPEAKTPESGWVGMTLVVVAAARFWFVEEGQIWMRRLEIGATRERLLVAMTSMAYDGVSRLHGDGNRLVSDGPL